MSISALKHGHWLKPRHREGSVAGRIQRCRVPGCSDAVLDEGTSTAGYNFLCYVNPDAPTRPGAEPSTDKRRHEQSGYGLGNKPWTPIQLRKRVPWTPACFIQGWRGSPGAVPRVGTARGSCCCLQAWTAATPPAHVRIPPEGPLPYPVHKDVRVHSVWVPTSPQLPHFV